VRTARLQVGDVVEVDVRGTVFPARVVDLDPSDWASEHIEVAPLARNVTYFHPTRRQVRRRLDPPPRVRRV
jgi:hypothetical protein